MNKGKITFSQIMSSIPEREFKACVDRYKGNYRWHFQFTSLTITLAYYFAYLTY